MSTKLTWLGAFTVGAAAGLIAGCQTYDFEPVEPLAVAQTTKSYEVAGRQAKPNLMLLIDTSKSMIDPVDPTDPDCIVGGELCGSLHSGGAQCNEAVCPTRWGELKQAMSGFLSTYGTVGRMGLTFYPVNDFCQAPGLNNIVVPIPATPTDDENVLRDSAQQILTAIDGVTPVGGTPTGNALYTMGNYPPLLSQDEGRSNFVIVLTDGLPNCNQNNPNDYNVNQAACRCTLAQGSCVSHDFCQGCNRLGCLDKDGTVQQVRSLRSRGIQTIVIGFGADLASGDGPDVLNAMAQEGGFARSCPNGTDAECGGTPGSCNPATNLCSTKFYQAANGDDLAKALADISAGFKTDPCVYTIDATPPDPSLISVLVNGERIERGDQTWRFDAGKIVFQGDMCTQLQQSTTTAPMKVEFRIVEPL